MIVQEYKNLRLADENIVNDDADDGAMPEPGTDGEVVAMPEEPEEDKDNLE